MKSTAPNSVYSLWWSFRLILSLFHSIYVCGLWFLIHHNPYTQNVIKHFPTRYQRTSAFHFQQHQENNHSGHSRDKTTF